MGNKISIWERGFLLKTRDGQRAKFLAMVNDGGDYPVTVIVGYREIGYTLKGEYAKGKEHEMDLVVTNQLIHSSP